MQAVYVYIYMGGIIYILVRKIKLCETALNGFGFKLYLRDTASFHRGGVHISEETLFEWAPFFFFL